MTGKSGKQKYYAVATGRRSGIFTDWPTTEAQVKGFAGARYKGFASKEEAEKWLLDPVIAKKTASNKSEAKVLAPAQSRPGAIVCYTDGGCSNNPGPGGYGVVIEESGKRRELSGGYRLTTNNRMEMMAAIIALEELKDCKTPIDLHSDSSYLVNGISKGWVRKWRKNGWRKSDGGAVLNVDLWQRLIVLVENLDVRLHWLKGHAGNEGNERCDSLAVAATRRPGLPIDAGYKDSNGREENGGE